MARRILLINPNSSVATTRMMVAIAQDAAADGAEVVGATATRSPPMITDLDALDAAAAEVVEIALAGREGCDGVIVAAFGDPGLAEIRARTLLPAVGIAEAAMLEAAMPEAVGGGRRFGIASTTPDLADRIGARVDDLGLAGLCTGIRLTPGDPHALMADPERLHDALALAVTACVARDGAQAVIIGGGPLWQAARRLQPTMSTPIVAPIPAAIRRVARLIEGNSETHRR